MLKPVAACAVDWSTRPDDVWRLKSFEFEVGDGLTVTSGPAHLVIAAHDHPDGDRSAVWAALFPDEPAEIEAEAAGNGEHAEAIFLRFHPSRVGALFPRQRVEGAGDARWLVRARHLYAHKINASWQWDNMPVVPYERSIVLDIDTAEGPRRFYMADTSAGTVAYEPAFEQRTTPDPFDTPVESAEATAAFDAVWEAFDRAYPMFGIKEGVDWSALRRQYRPLARESETAHEVAGVIALMLAHLEDLHVWVKCSDAWVHCYNRFRVTNGNWNATRAQLTDIEQRNGLAFGRTEDGLVVNLPRWLDLDAEGEPIDRVGIAPDVAIDGRPGDFKRGDRVMDAALKQLRDLGNEAPGKAD